MRKIIVVSILWFVCVVGNVSANEIKLDMTKFGGCDDSKMPQVHIGDVVTLNFAIPHGPELVIGDPDEQWFNVTPIKFTKLKEFRLNVKEAEGRSGKEKKHIFGKAGSYVIQMGSEMNSESPNIDASCTINFVDQ